MTSNRLAYAFGAAAAVLAGLGGLLAYSNGSGSASVVYVPPPPTAPPPPGAAPSAAAGLPFPVVLPPRVPPSELPALREAFLRQCRRLAEPLTGGGGGAAAAAAEDVRCYGAYAASLNYERGAPNWVLECFDRDPTAGGDADAANRAHSRFYADDSVPPAWRVGPGDYAPAPGERRGLSRGHLAPAQLHRADAEAAGGAAALNQRFLDATFNMSANIAPQDMAANATDWLRVETLAKAVLRRAFAAPGAGGKGQVGGGGPNGNRVCILSGPIYAPSWARARVLPGGGEALEVRPPTERPPPASSPGAGEWRRVFVHDSVGGGRVAVPTHFFKIIVADVRPAPAAPPTRAVAAFLVPNGGAAREQPLESFLTTVPALERLAGRPLLPGLLAPSASSSAAAVVPLCGAKSPLGFRKCENHTSGLFQHYRGVARLRQCHSVPELNGVFAELVAGSADAGSEGGKSGAGGSSAKGLEALRKEYEERKSELLTAATGSIDDY